METIRIFTGADKREAVGLHVFMQSVLEKASLPVSFTPITERFSALAGGRGDGTNAFTYGRFLVPYFMGWTGLAIFADGADMLVRADIAELWRYGHAREHAWNKALLVVKHEYRTRALRKYVGTELEAANADYPRKNWSSLMLINCGHYAWRDVTPERIARSIEILGDGSYMNRFQFCGEEQIGELPAEWNHLVGEYAPNPKAKLAHFTLGLPCFTEYRGCEFADEWRAVFRKLKAGLQHEEERTA